MEGADPSSWELRCPDSIRSPDDHVSSVRGRPTAPSVESGNRSYRHRTTAGTFRPLGNRRWHLDQTAGVYVATPLGRCRPGRSRGRFPHRAPSRRVWASGSGQIGDLARNGPATHR